MSNRFDQFSTEELIAEVIRRTKKFSITEDHVVDSVQPRLTINQIRWLNTRYLVKKYGGVSNFANALGKGQSQTSQFAGISPIKNIGNKIAREIEAAHSLELGWLDTYHSAIQYPSDEDVE